MVKESIIERFAEAYKIDGFPPLAGKIMGVFYMSDSKYFCFEDLVLLSKGSKGAVSKTLKLLIGLSRIGFIYSKERKSKRLFYLDTKGIRDFLEIILANYKKQDILLKECLQLRSDENQELNMFIKNSLTFNDEVISLIEEKMNKYFN
ncbi:hypothetical protein [Labilibacter marinus]|uniref:hypothetical protein n=1 Tax=Labilibacter marinus TaxID=1477105 RepID=UPI000837A0C7|nr:hypothetical protein [Labilibacter marinus]